MILRLCLCGEILIGSSGVYAASFLLALLFFKGRDFDLLLYCLSGEI